MGLPAMSMPCQVDRLNWKAPKYFPLRLTAFALPPDSHQASCVHTSPSTGLRYCFARATAATRTTTVVLVVVGAMVVVVGRTSVVVVVLCCVSLVQAPNSSAAITASLRNKVPPVYSIAQTFWAMSAGVTASVSTVMTLTPATPTIAAAVLAALVATPRT